MRLAYLGEQSHHYDNLRSHLGRVGIDIPTLNLPAYMAREEGWVRNKRPTLLGRTCNRVKHVCSQIHGVVDREHENRLIRTIDEQDIGERIPLPRLSPSRRGDPMSRSSLTSFVIRLA